MNLKQEVAEFALNYVKDRMVLGLGTGSTSSYFIQGLGEKIRNGKLQEIQGVPTSRQTEELAREVGIPLTSLADQQWLDLAVDGADEVDPNLDLIKGMGHALLREKMVEINARKFIVVADETKLVDHLGQKHPLPVEILPFESDATLRWLDSLGCKAKFASSSDGSRIYTDNGNFIAHCRFERGIENPHELARKLADRPGVIEHGLFLDMADIVIVATSSGIKLKERIR